MDAKPSLQVDQQRHEGKLKSSNNFLQKETFYSVMQCLQQVNTQQWETIFTAGNFSLDDAVTLNKYIGTAYSMLTSKDTSKFFFKEANFF